MTRELFRVFIAPIIESRQGYVYRKVALQSTFSPLAFWFFSSFVRSRMSPQQAIYFLQHQRIWSNLELKSVLGNRGTLAKASECGRVRFEKDRLKWIWKCSCDSLSLYRSDMSGLTYAFQHQRFSEREPLLKGIFRLQTCTTRSVSRIQY